ncbi:MAG: cation-translocating P-type ATPase [Candidatus Bathyarchaeota archaeon]|nr:cation-translocating P-type ATPase [Candidatus Bathyarchaeota archaeon]
MAVTEESWHALEAKDALTKLESSKTGLTSTEAAKRLQKYGPNQLITAKKTSPIKIFLAQFKSVLILILIAAALVSFATGHQFDAAIILIIVVISSALGFVQEYRAERALEALTRMLVPIASVIRDGHELQVPAKDIVPGDILALKEGEKVAADARLIEINNLHVNEAPLTGESIPVGKELQAVAENAAILDKKNMVFSGTEVTCGKGKALVVASGMNTEFGKIAGQVASVEKKETPLEKRTKEIGKWLGAAALIVSISVIILGVLRGLDLLEMFLFGIALAVAAVPEALPAIVTGSLAVGMYKMAKKNALVRKMPAVETLGSTTVICTDKTGTLTKGEMTVRKIYADGQTFDVSGVGYSPQGKIEADQKALESKCFSLLMKGAALCNDAEVVLEDNKWVVKGDPTEGALVVATLKAGIKHQELRSAYQRINEFPFSSDRKRMTTIHAQESEDQKTIFMKGAPEIILRYCTAICRGNKTESLTENQLKEILKQNEKMASDGLRVLGIAYKEKAADPSHFKEETSESELVFLGLVGMMDPPRKEVMDAVKLCRKIKIKPVMITGDHKLTALAVAKELGIYREGDEVLTGEELERMSQEELEAKVRKVSVYARVSPLHKLKIVEAWKKLGEIVAMTGDGVNDAPALKKADIGVAMGITGTEVTKESADLVLADDNFATIVNAVEMGRWTYDNIKKYLTYLLQANLVEIIILSFAVLAGFPLPLIPVQILYINLATDGLPAIALGLSPPEPDIMKRPPRSPKETIFTKDVKVFLLRAILIEVPLLIWVFTSALPLGEEIARTRLFLVLVFFELVLALSCRSLKYNITKAPPHKLLVGTVIWEIGLIALILNVPFLRESFGLAPIGIYEVALIAGLSGLVLFTIELTKWIMHRRDEKFEDNTAPLSTLAS